MHNPHHGANKDGDDDDVAVRRAIAAAFVTHVVTGRATLPCGLDGPIIPPGGIAAIARLAVASAVATSLVCASVLPSGDIASCVVVWAFAAIEQYLLWRATTTDPGIILPARVGAPPAVPQPFVVAHSGEAVTLGVCPSCRIVRPPRSSHCRVMGACVAEYDHQCMWTGTCIGSRTFRYFAGFCYACCAHAAFALCRTICSAVRMRSDASAVSRDVAGAAFQAAATYLVIAFAAFAFVFAAVHSFFVTRHACTGTTGKDRSSASRKGVLFQRIDEPWSLSRWRQRLFGPLPPSEIDELLQTLRRSGRHHML